MRLAIAIALLLGLAACGGSGNQKFATFACPNGPDIAVSYADDSATLLINDGRRFTLPADPTRDGVYAIPGVAWQETSFRTGRLTDGPRSFTCDQSSI